MRRLMLALAAAWALPLAAAAQDSGPGPIDPGQTSTYEALFIKLRPFAQSEATFLFTADGEEASDETTSGELELLLAEDVLTGTWNAYDVGDYAVWSARAESGGQRFSTVGLSNPSLIIGWGTIQPTSSTRRRGLLSLLLPFGFGGQPVFFYGQATEATEPEPVE
jgi:hypothetical protein